MDEEGGKKGCGEVLGFARFFQFRIREIFTAPPPTCEHLFTHASTHAWYAAGGFEGHSAMHADSDPPGQLEGDGPGPGDGDGVGTGCGGGVGGGVGDGVGGGGDGPGAKQQHAKQQLPSSCWQVEGFAHAHPQEQPPRAVHVRGPGGGVGLGGGVGGCGGGAGGDGGDGGLGGPNGVPGWCASQSW